MPRPRAKVSARTYHISGQSVVRVDGRSIYLGKQDSAEAIARYAVLIAIYQANGLRLPEDFDSESLADRAAAMLGEP